MEKSIVSTEASVAESVRDAVARHSRRVLQVERCSRDIARLHKCQSETLIRQALLQSLKNSRQVAEL